MKFSFLFVACALFLRVPAQAELARPQGGATTQAPVGSPNCDAEYNELGCSQFENDSELKDKLRSCNKKEELVDMTSIAKTCLSSGVDAWKDLAKSLAHSPAALANATADNLKEQVRVPVAVAGFLKKCLSDIECKKNVFRAGNKREPNPSDLAELEGYEKSWLPAPITKMSALWEKAAANQFSKTGTHSPWMEAKLAELSGPPAAKPSGDNWNKAKNLLNSKYKKFKCMGAAGQTEMACYAFFSAIDPALAYSAVSKIPRLAKLVEASKGGGAGAKGSEVAAQEIERLKNLTPQEKGQMLAANGALSKEERVKTAEQAIQAVSQRELTQAQREAVVAAHEVGGPGRNFDYSFSELREKADILKKAGFTDAETQVLMRKGITGKGDGWETVRVGRDQSGQSMISKVTEGDEILKRSDNPAKIGEAKRFFKENAERALGQARFQQARYDFIRAGDIGGYASTIRSTAKAEEELLIRTNELKALRAERDLPSGTTRNKPTPEYYRSQIANYEETIKHLKEAIASGF